MYLLAPDAISVLIIEKPVVFLTYVDLFKPLFFLDVLGLAEGGKAGMLCLVVYPPKGSLLT